MQVRRRLRSGVRRTATRVRGVAAARPWILTIGEVEPLPGRDRLAGSYVLGWWSRRATWPAPEGSTSQIPARTLVVHLHATAWESLLDLAGDAMATRGVRDIHIRIDRWRAPMVGWSGQLGPLASVRSWQVRLPRVEPGPIDISISLVRQRSLREVIGAALDVLRPNRPLPTPVSPALAASGAAPAWLWPSADTGITLRHLALEQQDREATATVRQRADGLPPGSRPDVDIELVAEGSQPFRFGTVPSRYVELGAAGTLRAAGAGILLDPRSVAPVRWLAPATRDADGRLVVRGTDADARWALMSNDTPPVRDPDATSRPTDDGTAGHATVADRPEQPTPQWRPIGGAPGSGVLADLPRWWAVRSSGLDTLPPEAAARLLASVAATGLVIRPDGLPDAALALLDDELRTILGAPLPDQAGETIEWEIRSVRQRRAALRGHATPFRLPVLLTPDAPIMGTPPSVTALLVTRRPQLALGALRMMAAQTYPALEVLVGLHGVARTPALEAAVAGAVRPVSIVDLPADATLGQALGITTSRASGSIVTKVDDDDLYGPDHIWDLVLARATSGATVVGKAAEFVTFDQRGITVRRHRMQSSVYDRVVAGGTIMVSRGDLEVLGGWRPVPSGVDRAFLDRVLQAGALIYRTWPFGFVYRRHGEGHTWSASDEYFLRDIGQTWQGLPPYPEFDQGPLVPVG